MLSWFAENWGTLVIGFGVFVLACLAVRSLHRNKKKTGCSFGCDGCQSGHCQHQDRKS